MAERKTRVCDWRGSEKPDAPECGKPAAFDFVTRAGEITLAGDLCAKHRDEYVRLIRLLAGGDVDNVVVDSKPRQSYITLGGNVVTTKDIRAWAVEEGHVKSQHGRLRTELIQQYVDSH